MRVDEPRIDILVVQLKYFLEGELSVGVVLVLDIFEAKRFESINKGFMRGGSGRFNAHVQEPPRFFASCRCFCFKSEFASEASLDRGPGKVGGRWMRAAHGGGVVDPIPR